MVGRRSMDETPTFGRRQRWSDFVTRWDWDEKGGYRSARFFGGVVTDFIHNVKSKNGKFYPEFCHGWDVDNCKFFPDREARCPCCALGIKGNYRYFMNVIDLEAEENKPSKLRSDWTPIRFIDMSSTLFERVKELKTVNKGNSIADAKHGANIQIKYNPNLDPGSQYAATLDTKDVPITEEQKEYIVVQKYPDGSTRTIRGEDGYPAQFEYIRCVNSRDDMVRSLKTHGYYGEQNDVDDVATSSATTVQTKEQVVSEVMQSHPESTVEEMKLVSDGKEINLDTVFPPETTKETVVEKPKTKQKPKEIYDECPTEFGKYANHMDCHTQCGLRKECEQATLSNKAKSETKRKPVVEIPDDDDDTI